MRKGGGCVHKIDDTLVALVIYSYVYLFIDLLIYGFIDSSIKFPNLAKLATDKQDDKVRDQRRREVKQRQEIYQWGDDPDYKGLPGFIKSSSADALPKDVQFTNEDAGQLLDARRKGIFNTLHIKFRGLFHYWEEFDDFKKVGCITAMVVRWSCHPTLFLTCFCEIVTPLMDH